MKTYAILGALALITSSASAQNGFTGFSVVRSITAGGNTQYKISGNWSTASSFTIVNAFDFNVAPGASGTMNARHQDNATDANENPSQSWNPSANGLLTVRNEDSWVTISGNSTAGLNDTSLDPSFVPSDASYIPYNAGWFDTTPGTPNSILAGGTQGGYRMLVMQIVRAGGVEDALSTFSCILGYKVSGTTTALAGSGSFTIGTPAPGALALLGLAGLTGRRRRA